MKEKLKSGIYKFTALIVVLLLLVNCDKNEPNAGFIVDFTFEYMDDNNVKFINNSEGEYYSLDWDFANGETINSTDKSKTYSIYYPESGEYSVTLKALNYTGESKSVTKIVNINNDDFILSFTADVNATKPNYVNLNNTSIGTYDSFTWFFRADSIENEVNAVAYFPFTGSHNIELRIIKDGVAFSSFQSVNITQNDPDYESNLTLVWSDEFNGTSVNTEDWTFETGASGWGNNELQNYTNGDNVTFSDGKLIITAKKVDGNQVAGSYTSTRIITKGKKEFTYGKMEIRAKLPSGRGIWPAIWMLGGDISSVGWPACGEIDILEYVGYQPNTVHATVHTTSGSGGSGDGNSKTLDTAEEEFHIYGLLWTENEMVFYTDEPENVTHSYSPSNKTVDNWPFDKPQFFILNVAVGGNWGGVQGIDNSIFPQSMEIDYVRVYQ